MKQKITTFSRYASMACIIHCLLTPILVIGTPFIGHMLENIWVELGLLGVSILCGAIIIYNGYCTHKKTHTIILFILGFILWSTHLISEHTMNLSADFILLILGASFIVVSYYINHRMLKCCNNNSCNNTKN